MKGYPFFRIKVVYRGLVTDAYHSILPHEKVQFHRRSWRGDPARELGPLREIAHRLEKNSLGLISSQGDVAQENI